MACSAEEARIINEQHRLLNLRPSVNAMLWKTLLGAGFLDELGKFKRPPPYAILFCANNILIKTDTLPPSSFLHRLSSVKDNQPADPPTDFSKPAIPCHLTKFSAKFQFGLWGYPAAINHTL